MGMPLFQVPVFVICCVGLLLGGKEVAQGHIFWSVGTEGQIQAHVKSTH